MIARDDANWAIEDFKTTFVEENAALGDEFDYENLNEDQRAAFDELEAYADEADNAFLLAEVQMKNENAEEAAKAKEAAR
jgi:hypothetical protein